MNTMGDDILRPAKRSKKENSEPPFFLDSFPKEVLDYVVRYISGIPNAKNWEMHLDLSNLVELFGVRGGLGSFMKSRFKTLCVGTTKDGEAESDRYGWDKRDGYHLWTNSMADAHKYILAGGGESLETLVLGHAKLAMEYDGKGLINDFVKHCPNVTSLSVDEKGSSWVNAFGKQLEKLELRTDFPIEFPVYSTKLREFTLNTNSYGDISTELWRRIGSNLEKLTVYRLCLSENGIGDIKQHCRNLKSVSLEGIYEEEKAAIANLLASYSGQLEYALLKRFDEVHLKEVADACPKARFHLDSFDDKRRLFIGLNLLGPRLEVIRSFGSETTENFDGWKNAWSKATTFRKLDIEVRKVCDAKAIFSTPKEHLKELSLCLGMIPGAEDAKKVMDVFAKGTKRLETFKYVGRYSNRDSTKKFFDQNKDSLALISIFPTVRAGDKKLDELLTSFLELPLLKEVCLDYQIPDDTLNALEKRGVYWSRIRHPY